MPETEEYTSRAGGINMAKLCRAMRGAGHSLAAFRRKRTRDIRDYVGSNYGENGSAHKMLLNGLAQYVQVTSQQVIGENPRFLLSTTRQQHRAKVSAIQAWLNKQVVKIGLPEVLRECYVDACFCLGITKVALSTPADAATSGWSLAAGEPFVANIDLDDFLYDVHARRMKEASFVAHRFRMPLSIAREWKEFNKSRKELEASDDPEFTPEGDDRTAWMSRNEEGDGEEFEEMVDLWEVWLPRHKLLLTMEHDTVRSTRENSKLEPLRVQRWMGPEAGPYHFLGLGPPVPDNAFSKAPIQDIRDLNSLLNNVWRKIEDDARNFKVVTAIQGGADADGKRQVEANHGDAIRVDNPEAVREVIMRGVNPVMFNFILQTRNVFNSQAGNLDLLAGTAPQSRTASQDEMLNANAGAMMSALQGRMTKHVASVGEALAWFYHHNPELNMETEYIHKGLPKEYAITRTVTPEDRLEIAWRDLEMRVDPYSMPFMSPSRMLGILNSTLQQVMPALPLIQQQGGAVDFHFYFEKVAEYTGCPDINYLIKFAEPMQQEQGAEEMPHMLPGSTTRTYERRSVGQNSDAAQEAQAINDTMPSFSENGSGGGLGGYQ